MSESADAAAMALDATAAVGSAPERSRLERAAAAWEYAVDLVNRMGRKVAKMEPQLEDARHALAEAEALAASATEEFDRAKAEIGGAS